MTSTTRLMYIDDEADIRGIMEYAMEDEEDFELELCASGKEALDKIPGIKPDLILLDVMMPGMDGPTTLSNLRNIPDTQDTPVIFVTAKAQPHEIDKYKAMGVLDVIVKPFDPIHLVDYLRATLKNESKKSPAKTKDNNKLLKLIQAFQSELPERLAVIEQCWEKISTSSPDKDMSNEFHRQVHSLAGSSSTFGYRSLGEAARELEQKFSSASDSGTDFSADTKTTINGLLNKLQKLANSHPDVDIKPQRIKSTATSSDTERLLYIVEDDKPLLDMMTAQLENSGWEVKGFTDASSAKQALLEHLPSAITIDLTLPEGKLAGIKLLQKFTELNKQDIPKIIITSTWNWEARLAAARVGVEAYMSKPLDIPLLIETLDKLSRKNRAQAFRILIVEDTVSLAEYYAHVLEKAGMLTRVVTKPEYLLENLSAFQPELILMDIYMPGCTGIEAAHVIRQDSRFVSVPIVFLSSEEERERQIGAMQTGADDFLVKPISDHDLIAAVTTRAERFRNLSSIMHRDSLTGLLNRASFTLQLEAEFARAVRRKTSTAFALIDIDKFKSINDEYGHPVGDTVIKGIARLLRTRLRKSDIIGRYGGEEFAIFMPDTTVHEAQSVLDKIRDQFQQQTFEGNKNPFSSTFSTGISSSLDYQDVDKLINAADKALYLAKAAGRNTIILDSPDN